MRAFFLLVPAVLAGCQASHGKRVVDSESESCTIFAYIARIDAIARSNVATLTDRASITVVSARLSQTEVAIRSDLDLWATPCAREVSYLMVRIAEQERLIKYATARVDYLDCKTSAQRIELRARAVHAECLDSRAVYAQCESARGEKKADGAIAAALGCAVGAVVSGPAGLAVCAAGFLAGSAYGDTEPCQEPECSASYEDAYRDTLRSEGLNRAPACIEPLRTFAAGSL